MQIDLQIHVAWQMEGRAHPEVEKESWTSSHAMPSTPMIFMLHLLCTELFSDESARICLSEPWNAINKESSF